MCQPKIDFFEKLQQEGFEVLIPCQAIDELIGLGADIALKILENNKFRLIREKGKDADGAILKIAKKNPSAVVATLDCGLKKKIKNPKMVIRGRKKLEII